MKELLEKMQETYKAFETDAMLQLEKQNKAAGTASLKLDKLAKEFRKASLEESKK